MHIRGLDQLQKETHLHRCVCTGWTNPRRRRGLCRLGEGSGDLVQGCSGLRWRRLMDREGCLEDGRRAVLGLGDGTRLLIFGRRSAWLWMLQMSFKI